MKDVKSFLEEKKSFDEIKSNYYKIIIKLIEAGVDKDEAIDVFKEYDNKKILYKNNKVYFQDFFKNNINHSSLEKFRDTLYKTNIEHNHKQILKRLRDKKNLINEETKKITMCLSEEGVTPELIGDIVGKKIASVPTTEVLNDILEKELANIQGEWNIESFKKRLKNTNANIISEENNKLVIGINDFKASSRLGTNNWCLVRNQSDYDYYTRAEDGYKQVNFVYDFNKPSESNDSMIAVLTRINGAIYQTYNKNDDEISNKNVANIEFPVLDRKRLEYLIEDEFDNEYDSDKKIKELITYGFYEKAKEKLTKEKYQSVLSNMFSSSVGKVTFSGDVVEFFNELEKNDTNKLNGYDLSSWLRESVYLGDYDKIKTILEKDFVKKLINEDLNHFKVDLTNIYNDIFISDNLKGFKFAKDFHNIMSQITGEDNLASMGIFDIGKYSESALEFIENNMEFIKKHEMKDNNLSKSMLNLLDFDYSEESIENYFKFMNITEKNDDLLLEMINQSKIDTLVHNKGYVFAKIKLPIIKILGKERFEKESLLSKEMINVYGMLNHNMMTDNTSAGKMQELLTFNIEKLNKKETEKFFEILIGKNNRKESYDNAGVVLKSTFKMIIKKHKDNLDEAFTNQILKDFQITEIKENKRPKRKM